MASHRVGDRKNLIMKGKYLKNKWMCTTCSLILKNHYLPISTNSVISINKFVASASSLIEQQIEKFIQKFKGPSKTTLLPPLMKSQTPNKTTTKQHCKIYTHWLLLFKSTVIKWMRYCITMNFAVSVQEQFGMYYTKSFLSYSM